MNTSGFAAFVGQIAREYPACFRKYVVCKTVVAMGRMSFVRLLLQRSKLDPVLRIAVWFTLAGFPFVISGSVYTHDLAQEVHRIFAFHFFDYFVVFTLPVNHQSICQEVPKGRNTSPMKSSLRKRSEKLTPCGEILGVS